MHLNSDEKVEIFEKYGKGKTDTGSPEAQIALFSIRIAHLTEHLRSNHKDYTTARALKALVGKRRRLLDYLSARTSTATVPSLHKKSSVSESKPTSALLEDYNWLPRSQTPATFFMLYNIFSSR